MQPLKITIVGTGYVGQTTAVGLAEKGFTVTCVDERPEIVDKIQNGFSTLYEPGLQESLKKHPVTATTNLSEAVSSADIILICVGTPALAGGESDLSALKRVSDAIGQSLGDRTYPVIVIKSTVPPGTTLGVVKPIVEKSSGRQMGESDGQFGLAMVPEFLREGKALADTRNPGRIVVGSETKRTTEILQKLFSVFDVPVIHTSSATAEMAKYFSNALLATLISFSNEFANLAIRQGGIHFGHALEALSLDPRFSGEHPEFLGYLKPGCGFGGSCFPKDLAAIGQFAHAQGTPLTLVEAAQRVNTHQANQVVRQLQKILPDLKGCQIGIYGLAFKPDTDDVRHTPAAPIITELQKTGARVLAYDPLASQNYLTQYPAVPLAQTPQDLFCETDAILIVTPWSQFLPLFYDADLLTQMRTKIIFDCRSALDSKRMPKHTIDVTYLSPTEKWPKN